MAIGAGLLAGSVLADGDDHGDTRLAATRVEHYGVSQLGTLDSMEDVDVFRLDLQGRAELETRTSGALDLKGTLYDSEGAVLAEDDDGGTNLNFRIVETLDGGVYYVAVASDMDTGAYKMTARIRRDGDDHGNTAGASTVLPIGIRTTGRIAPADDVDTFRVEVSEATGLRISTGGPTDTTGELRDSADTVLAAKSDGGDRGNFRIERHVEPGVYYVYVMAAGNGSYTLGADPYASDAPDRPRGVFRASISAPIVQAKCVNCHVAGGEYTGGRLVFAAPTSDDHEARNFDVLRTFVEGGDDRVDLILDKVRGLRGHGGGEQIADRSSDFLALERFLTLLADEIDAETGDANSRPTLNAIGEQTVEVGAARHIDLVVSDRDSDDVHTLHATVGDSCVATVAVRDATVVVTGLLAGTADVTVTADDGEATSDPVTFTVTVEPPTVPAWALSRAAPAATAVDPCAAGAVLDHVFTDRAVQSVLLLADDAVIAERYADGYDIASLGTSWSVAKSFYSAAIGVAIDRGLITSLDQRASDFFTEWAGTSREAITVRDLLEMRAGLPGDTNIFVQYDQTAFALARNPVGSRGTTFRYSNATSQLFEPLLRRATGMDAHDWLADTLLEPIGVDRNAIGLWLDPTGIQPLTYCCLDMRPDDFARFGALFANEGVWNGARLLSADYVRTSLSAQSPFYGLQWWVMNAAYFEGVAPPIDLSAAHGLEGQHIYVWRDRRIVLVVLTKYEHDPSQGYVLSQTNYPSTCGARNTCPGATGQRVPSYDEGTLINRLADLFE